MAELTHEPEDGFHEIQLSGKEVIFLVMATFALSVLIFVCGLLVGRGVRAERGGDSLDAEPIASNAAPSTPSTAADVPAPQAAEAPAPPAEDELSYHKRLQGNTPPAERLKPQAAEQQPAKPAAPAPAAAQTPAPPPDTTAGPDVPSSGRPGTWVVQVSALQNRAMASTLVQRLIAKGYPAFLLNPAPGTPKIYRVQIGRYDDRREADQIARRLEKEEQLTPAIKR